MDKELKQIIITALNESKKEYDKRKEIYKYGVDLANYDNLYYQQLIIVLAYLLGDKHNKYGYIIEGFIIGDSHVILNGKKLETAEEIVNYLTDEKS